MLTSAGRCCWHDSAAAIADRPGSFLGTRLLFLLGGVYTLYYLPKDLNKSLYTSGTADQSSTQSCTCESLRVWIRLAIIVFILLFDRLWYRIYLPSNASHTLRLEPWHCLAIGSFGNNYLTCCMCISNACKCRMMRMWSPHVWVSVIHMSMFGCAWNNGDDSHCIRT